jgi:hypothetical protein
MFQMELSNSVDIRLLFINYMSQINGDPCNPDYIASELEERKKLQHVAKK